jgi:hypothetical protein
MRNPAHSACSPTAFSSELPTKGVLRYADPLTPLLPPFHSLPFPQPAEHLRQTWR